jgi:transcriptional regulator with XRE-family HTH domain
VTKYYYLKTLRLRRQYTQVELERLSHVAQNTISKLENEPERMPLFATVAALAKALHVRPEQLRFDPILASSGRRRRSSRHECPCYTIAEVLERLQMTERTFRDSAKPARCRSSRNCGRDWGAGRGIARI